MGLEPVILIVLIATLVGIVAGLRIILSGKVEWWRGRRLHGTKARLIGLAFLIAVIGMFVITMSFCPED